VATVSARFTVARYNLRDRNPAWKALDDRIIDHLRSHYLILRGDLDARPEAAPA
jgi:hypothetical protein